MKTELPVLDRTWDSEGLTLDHLSFSAIHSFRTCPRQFMFRYVLRLPDEKTFTSLVFGTSLHRAIEAHFRALMHGENIPDHDTLLGFFWDCWHSEDKPIHFNKKENLDTIGHLADRMLRAFEMSDFARPRGKIIGIEEYLRGTVVEDCPDFVARLDLLIDTGEALVITDFKTALSRWNPSKLAVFTPQLLVYSKLAGALADSKPIKLNFAVLTKRVKPILTLHPVDHDDEVMEETFQTIKENWEAIQREDFYPSPSPAHCPRCPFQETCRMWG